MPNTFDAVLILVISILPGFLTDTLIRARSAKYYREKSTFWRISESLLRSLYIHLTTLLIFVILWE
jgi:hypothetical protein